MWQLCVFFWVAVTSQCIRRDAGSDAVAEQKMLENIRPILDSYVANSLQRNQHVIEDLKQKMLSLESKLNGKDGTGAVFTRWGRSDCPPDKTTLIYSGYAGGSHYSHTGGAAEYICMPNDPILGDGKLWSNTGGYIYGAEYYDINIFGLPTGSVAPCAVCLGNLHTASLMIPGRRECYPGWTKAYHGDLTAGYHGHQAASQYICVDDDAQALPQPISNNGGKLFYGVRIVCGSLPCPPYGNKNLPCVVCMN